MTVTITHTGKHSVEISPRMPLYAALYYFGDYEPNYTLPAIPLEVHFYSDVMYIDDVSVPNDPIMVYGWDNWDKAPFTLNLD